MKEVTQKIAIPSILEIGKGNMDNIGLFLSKTGFKKVCLCFGEEMRNLFGRRIEESLDDVGIHFVQIGEISDISFESISARAFNLPPGVDALIGIGGGKAIDAVKYIAFLRKLPFISIPTSTSNDGFASANASLIIGGKRMSVPAKTPFGIIADISVIKNAPDKFIYSGIGDLVSNITALHDWKFEEEHGKAVVNDFATMISQKAVYSFATTGFSSVTDDFFLKELVESLTLNGISMEIAGNSAPASGSEHLISHALDTFVEQPALHGVQVGIATYIMARVQKHKIKLVSKILLETGFFTYAKSLKLKKEDFKKAVDLAPSIKPNRYTYLHVDSNREKAKQIIDNDEVLSMVLY